MQHVAQVLQPETFSLRKRMAMRSAFTWVGDGSIWLQKGESDIVGDVRQGHHDEDDDIVGIERVLPFFASS